MDNPVCTIGNARLRFVLGDLTAVPADALVNAANPRLAGGGGVDGAIHRVGGASILEECRRIVAERGQVPAGQAVVTGAGDLPARFVIHTVGPVWRGGEHGEREALASCYRQSLQLAAARGLGSVAFPSISTGAYGFPLEEGAAVAVAAVTDFLRQEHVSPAEVIFVLFDRRSFEAYAAAARRLLGDASGERP